MDELDLADERERLLLEAAIQQRRPTGPAADGTCHYCDEPVAAGKRWCDADCRDAWESDR